MGEYNKEISAQSRQGLEYYDFNLQNAAFSDDLMPKVPADLTKGCPPQPFSTGASLERYSTPDLK